MQRGYPPPAEAGRHPARHGRVLWILPQALHPPPCLPHAPSSAQPLLLPQVRPHSPLPPPCLAPGHAAGCPPQQAGPSGASVWCQLPACCPRWRSALPWHATAAPAAAVAAAAGAAAGALALLRSLLPHLVWCQQLRVSGRQHLSPVRARQVHLVLWLLSQLPAAAVGAGCWLRHQMTACLPPCCTWLQQHPALVVLLPPAADGCGCRLEGTSCCCRR